jgi:hypothetical protein
MGTQGFAHPSETSLTLAGGQRASPVPTLQLLKSMKIN